MTPCGEFFMTETQVLALIDQGLMPLVSYKDRRWCAWPDSAPSTRAPLPFSVPF